MFENERLPGKKKKKTYLSVSQVVEVERGVQVSGLDSLWTRNLSLGLVRTLSGPPWPSVSSQTPRRCWSHWRVSCVVSLICPRPAERR